MTTLTTIFTCNGKSSVSVDVRDSSLSMEQIQVLSGVIYALYSTVFLVRGDTVSCTAECNSITDEVGEESFTWNHDDTINCTPTNGGVTQQLTTERKDGYLILRGSIDCDGDIGVATYTFKNGLLESMDGAPAIKIENLKQDSIKQWYHRNTCYNKDHPDQPSDINGPYHSHHNVKGQLHRPVAAGPAVSYIENGEVVDDESTYYIHGEICDKDGKSLKTGQFIFYWATFLLASFVQPSISFTI